ncbi:MAG TPA: SRPBCC family protein [Candidatus Sulfotelmatobacter sp.]|nr:SRPBCC family protein [Candidatus Sulfotelmatobacter sp.]
MRRPALLVSLLLILAGAYLAIVLAGRPDATALRNPLVVAGLKPIGVAAPSWQTMVLIAARDTDLPPARLWATWERLEAWPSWAAPLVVEARWLDATGGWRPGARFEQVLDLGPLLSRVRSTETVGIVEPGRLVSWWKDTGGIKSNHTWSFEVRPDGGSRVVDVEIFDGIAIALARPIFEARWQTRFDDALDGLILAARRAK